jgi:hypothetical protein
VRSGFLFPLPFCLLSVAFYIPRHSQLPVVAQAIDARQVEADRLLQQRIQQYQTNQFPAALKSWQQALQIYRALKNREGEGGTLGKLMQSFYQNLQNNPDKAQALRQAMLATMKTHPQPRNWAAFTLSGEAE